MTDHTHTLSLEREMWARGITIAHEHRPCLLCHPDGNCEARWAAIRTLARRHPTPPTPATQELLAWPPRTPPATRTPPPRPHAPSCHDDRTSGFTAGVITGFGLGTACLATVITAIT